MITDKQDLERTSPERQGIASSAVLQFVEAIEKQIHDLHSFMLLRHGFVIAEGWWRPHESHHPHTLFSVSKSFTSTAVGLAVAEGRFSLDDAVISFFPDDLPTEISDSLAAMRVRHLLSMSTGHAVDTWSFMTECADGDWIKAFLNVPVLHTPGTHFLYNTGATYMLSAIVQKTTGLTLVDYLTPRLFERLGIEKATWENSPQGINLGGIGLSITTEALARFGQLYLQKGVWQGQQILSEAWIAEATASQISNGEGGPSDWTQGYGYQFWRCRHGAYRGDGVFGQYCIVMPEQDAVLAITGGIDIFDAQQPLDLVWDILRPAMQAEPLPVDASAQMHLAEKLSSLTLPPVQGETSSPLSSQVSGRTYRIDDNELNIETITLNFTDSDCTVRVKTKRGEDTIACGAGSWLLSQTSLFQESNAEAFMPVAVSGAWTEDETFTMIFRLYETPFYHTLVCHFDGDDLMIETGVNVSLDSMRPLLLTGQAL